MPKGWRGSRQLLGRAEHLIYSEKKRRGERHVFFLDVVVPEGRIEGAWTFRLLVSI